MPVIILFLSSNPAGTDPLDLIKEHKLINERIRYLSGKDVFKLEQYHDISKVWFINTLLDYNPQIVHFSGHGSTGGAIIFKNDNGGEPEVVSRGSLEDIFKVLARNIFLVFLNACYSEEQAQTIAKYIDCVVGMSTTIYDDTAREFSAQFYSALANGKSVQDSFDLAVAQLKLLSRPDYGVPKLICKKGVDPTKLYLKSMTSNLSSGEICNMLSTFKDDYLKLVSNEIDIQEFFNTISKPILDLIIEPQGTKNFGKIKIESLTALFNNLSGKITEVNNRKNIGDDYGASIATALAKNISKNIIDKLSEICYK